MGESYSWVSVDDLVPWERNPKEHGDDIPQIARSIVRFGWLDPIVAWKSQRRIIGGHGRTLAAKLLLAEDPGRLLANDAPGPGLIPVRFVEFASEMEANAAGVALNRHTERNPMDEEAVAELIREMEEAGAGFEGLGYSEEEIGEMLAGGEEDAEPAGDDAPEPPEVPDSQPGAVYELGPHRLVCGDSTKPETWAALLRGEKVQMVWTDPPYGVAVNAVKDIEEAKRLHRRTDGLLVMNDSLTAEQLLTFLRAALGALFANCEPGASWYVAAPCMAHVNHAFGIVLTELEVWRHSLVWVKNALVFGRGDYHYRHEPIFYGWKPGAAHYFIDDHTQDSVHECPRPSRSEEHPTMKPVDLVRRHIRNSSKPGWIVGEPFGGSGTTLLAAASEGRVARLIELDPRYCDVIRRRWTTYADANGLDAGPGALRAS